MVERTMRILFVTDQIPYPPVAGAPLYTYNLLRRIAAKHAVWVVTFARTPEQVQNAAHLREFCHVIDPVGLPPNRALGRPVMFLRYLGTGRPPDLRFFYSQALAQAIRQLVATVDFDVVHIEHTEMALYLDALPVDMRRRAIWALHDIDWVKFARIATLETKRTRRFRLWLHSRLLRWWQPRQAARYRCCTTVSQHDRRVLLSANANLHVDVIPIGVDTELLQPQPFQNSTPDLVFVGNMGYRPNVDAVTFFCRQILPRIRAAVPGAGMWIVGINPTPEVYALAGNGVHVTGRVADVQPYYRQSSVCVVPLRAGSGVRVKILEAMALGRPVVTTSVGCEGLDVVDGTHLVIADDPHTFAEKTVQLLTDPEFRQHLVDGARKLVEQQYGWNRIAEDLLGLYAEIAR